MTATGTERKSRRQLADIMERAKKPITGSFTVQMLWNFDWLLLMLVLAISIFGIISIFAATGLPLESQPESFLELVRAQSSEYPRLQILWLLAGLVLIAGIQLFDYQLLGRFSNALYWINIALLVVVLFMERGRGNMAGWIRWGADATRTIQPAEFGKLAIIVALAKLFSIRTKPITRIEELIPVLAYIGLPLILIGAQPDFGTAMVYVFIFAVMLFASGASGKLLLGMVAVVVLMLVPIWFFMQNESSDFRTARIISFLNPGADRLGAGFQTSNAQIAVGSGGMFGKGLFSPGSIATLNYIPDDYTDFVFAIVCETFGFVGGAGLVVAYLLLMVRFVVMSGSVKEDPFGSYVIIGVMAMMLVHILENVGMVVGLLPVTGIPLPLVSYGGSNFLTNMIGIGIVMNISMRNKTHSKASAKQVASKKPDEVAL